MPEAAKPAVREAAAKAGLDFDAFTPIDNTCPTGNALNDAQAGTGTSTTDWVDLVVGEGGVIGKPRSSQRCTRSCGQDDMRNVANRHALETFAFDFRLDIPRMARRVQKIDMMILSTTAITTILEKHSHRSITQNKRLTTNNKTSTTGYGIT